MMKGRVVAETLREQYDRSNIVEVGVLVKFELALIEAFLKADPEFDVREWFVCMNRLKGVKP